MRWPIAVCLPAKASPGSLLDGSGEATTMQSVPVPVASEDPTALGTFASKTAAVRASATSDRASNEAHSLSGQDVCKRMLIVLGDTVSGLGGSPILSAFLNPTVAMHLAHRPRRSHCLSTNSSSAQPVRKPTPSMFPACCRRRSSNSCLASTSSDKSSPLTLCQKTRSARCRPPPIRVQPTVSWGMQRSTSNQRPQAERATDLYVNIAKTKAGYECVNPLNPCKMAVLSGDNRVNPHSWTFSGGAARR